MSLGADAPDPTDVEIIVRLGVSDLTVVRRLVLDRPDALVRHWDGLMGALRGEAAAPVLTETKAQPDLRESADSTVGISGNDGSGDSGATDEEAPRRDLSTAVSKRLSALRAWRQDAGSDADAIGDDDLLRLAEEPPRAAREFKKFSSAVRTQQQALAGLLAGLQLTDGPASEAPTGPVTTEETPSPSVVSSPATTPDTSRDLARVAAPEVSPTAPAQSSVVSADLIRGDGFAPYDYAAAQLGSEVREITFDASGEESLEMTWATGDPDGGVRLFRVVTSAETPPDVAPELGRLVCATVRGQAMDAQAFQEPVRHVVVWANEGRTEAEARASQPRVWASGSCVLPITNFEATVDGGTVLGSWKAVGGWSRVEVLRIPTREARPDHFDGSFKLPSASLGESGFVDRDAKPGEEYEYRVHAVANIAGVDSFSPPVIRRITMDAVLVPVGDLRVSPSPGEGQGTYELRWTLPPQGEVEIYRTRTAPEAGLVREVVTRETLQRATNLLRENLLAWRGAQEGAEWVVRDVPWPEGWSRAYFTPVTVLSDDRIQVGPSVNLTRATPVEHLRLVERVNEQFLTLAWPEEVSTVKVFQRKIGGQLVDASSEIPIAEYTADEYRRQGGIHLPHRLPADGCSLHVVGAAYNNGRPVLSEPRTVDYAGLARIAYDISQTTERGLLGRKGTTITRVSVRAEPAVSGLPLVLVHNPRRLPLYLEDGNELFRRQMNIGAGSDEFMSTSGPLSPPGYVRLFADVSPADERRLAILDPALNTLWNG